MLPRNMSSDPEEYASLYPEPSHGGFCSPPMNMGLASDAYYHRPGPEGLPTTTLGFDAAIIYAEGPHGMVYNGRMSPSMFPEDGELRSSNLSIASGQSAPSSDVGSPRSNRDPPAPYPEWAVPQDLGVSPGIVGQAEYFGTEYAFAGPGMDEFAHFAFAGAKPPGFVDPSLIHHEINRSLGIPGFDAPFQQPAAPGYPASPALSGSPQMRADSSSPFMAPNNYRYSPYPVPMDQQGRRPSMVSFHSNYSAEQTYSGDESKEKRRCPDCGKTFKDLKAHMLTHQTERPEKCPIQTCEYHVKGFARKYDKNRHTLTHYKGTMVCGFCPGPGSAAEKSFNRADVFKRHLTAVHGVEQAPPNSRKKTVSTAVSGGKKLTGYAPDATGKCSTCSQTFANAQDFYEHLDDCVLRIVQQEDPAEAINAQRLAEVENDRDVVETLEKNKLPTTTQTSPSEGEEDEEMAEDDDAAAAALGEGEAKALGVKTSSPSKKAKGNPPNGVQKSKGLTHSRGGMPLATKSRSRKNRKDYPSSWGFDKGQMTMKKRVMAVFDGSRRLAKDDMMLSTEHEVRIRLSDGKAYVTDLDVQTLRRAEGFHSATEAERGVWISDDPTDDQFQRMLELSTHQ